MTDKQPHKPRIPKDDLVIPAAMKEMLKAIGGVYTETMKLPGDYHQELGEAVQVCFDKFIAMDKTIAEQFQEPRPPCEECIYQSKYAEAAQRIRDVIAELERMKKKSSKDRYCGFIDCDHYHQGVVATCEKVIALLQGVKKE